MAIGGSVIWRNCLERTLKAELSFSRSQVVLGNDNERQAQLGPKCVPKLSLGTRMKDAVRLLIASGGGSQVGAWDLIIVGRASAPAFYLHSGQARRPVPPTLKPQNSKLITPPETPASASPKRPFALPDNPCCCKPGGAGSGCAQSHVGCAPRTLRGSDINKKAGWHSPSGSLS